MLDPVVRKLIEYGYERALRQELLGGSVRLGPDQLPRRVGAATARRSRGSTSTEVPDLYLTQFPITNAAAIGSGKPMVRRQLAHGRRCSTTRSCAPSSATRPATSCPTTCSTGPR